MNKICTSIDQSQKLIELGIDVNTADMLWTYDSTVNDINGLNVISKHFKPEENDIPAWSLNSLIDILPDTITNEDGTVFGLNIKKNFIEYYSPSMGALYATYHSIIAEDLVDAAFETVCWLKENKKL